MPLESSSKSWSSSFRVNTSFEDVDIVSGHTVGSGHSQQTVPSASGVNSYSRTTQENPKWRYLVKNHGNATTPFTASRDVQWVSNGTAHSYTYNLSGGVARTTVTDVSGVLPFLGLSVGPDGNVLNSALAAAKAKVYKKLAGIQTPFQTGVFLGEFRETLHMIKHPAEGLSKLILGEQFMSTKQKLRRASLRNRRPLKGDKLRRSLSKAVADSWLENAFGWQPFIKDIESAMGVYNDKLNQVEYIPIRCIGKARESLGAPLVNDFSIQGFIGYRTFDYRSQSCSVYVYGEARNQPHGLKAALGITWGQFVPTLWELLPFSFLADYFVNIGDVLANASVDIGAVQRLSSTYVNKGEVLTILSDFNYIGTQTPTSYGSASGGSPAYKRQNATVVRSEAFDISIPPGLTFKFPMTAHKWANMGALIVGLWQGGISRRYAMGRS